jgi:beta-galactosidase
MLTDDKQATESISRRRLLGGAAMGAVGLVSALDSASAFAQTRPASEVSPTRIRESFDFDWRFFRGDVPGAHQPEFSERDWRTLDLPHDWTIEGPLSQAGADGKGGGIAPTGIGWYRKRFRLPDSYKERRVVIEFDGVYENSEVWINGQRLGKRPYGYISFWYDLTPHLNFGARDNVMAVKVDNSHQPNCRWYSGSGIYRHTWLLVTGNVHVAVWGTFVSTPAVTQEFATVQMKTRVRNDGRTGTTCTLLTSVIDGEGKVVQTMEAGHDLEPDEEYEFLQDARVNTPHLWSVEDPFLYKVRSTVRERDRVVDEFDTPLGIREAVFDADRGFLLNGARVKLNGVCVHHDGGSVGAAVPARVWERRLEILKEMGCNSIRMSHNPPATDLLDLCDRMGFLVMDEFADEWKFHKPSVTQAYSIYFDEWSERDVKSMVHRDRNHPSVVLWSAGNEVHEQWRVVGVEIARRLVDLFHAEDPTRAVSIACHMIASGVTGGALPEFLAVPDVVGYNYVDRFRDRAEKYYSIDRQAYPRRRFIGSESPAMGVGGLRGDYRGLVPGETRVSPRGMGRGQDVDVELLWKFVRTYDYVAGDYMWTGIDCLGTATAPRSMSSSGVLDSCGFKKDGFYFYQSQWTSKPMLHLFPHWNWKGKEGQVIPVLCYTNCDTVELFVNGKSFGAEGYWFPRWGTENGRPSPRASVPRTTSDLHLTWSLPYEPGTLRAVGTKDGKIVATVEVATAGEPAATDLFVDRQTIAADRRDVVHIGVRIVDAQGRLMPTADNEVTFAVQGEGKIIGVDNGIIGSQDCKGSRVKAFNGLCLAIVQSTAKAGEIRVAATSPGLKSSSVTIATKA